MGGPWASGNPGAHVVGGVYSRGVRRRTSRRLLCSCECEGVLTVVLANH